MYIFLWHLAPSCGRFSIKYSRLRLLFPLGGQMGFFNWQIMTHFSHPGKKYNRSSLLSHEKNSRHKKRAPERHVHFYYSNPLHCTYYWAKFINWVFKGNRTVNWQPNALLRFSKIIWFINTISVSQELKFHLKWILQVFLQ